MFARPFELRRQQALAETELVERLNDMGYALRPALQAPGEFVVDEQTVRLVPRGRQWHGKTIRVVFRPPRGNAVQSPTLSITKSANPVSYTRAGDIIEYSYVVKDTGNLTLHGPFTVTDDKAAVTCPTTASLAPGESISCTASYKTEPG